MELKIMYQVILKRDLGIGFENTLKFDSHNFHSEQSKQTTVLSISFGKSFFAWRYTQKK